MLDKFADELREQREKSGISLQQLAAKTRIDLKFLEAIDQGNFAFLPELYVKAFVKQYAKTIGLDENLMIKKYEAAKEGREYDSNQVEVPEIKNDTPQKIEAQSPPVNKPVTPVKSYFENPLEKKSEDERKPNKQNILWLGFGAFAVLVFVIIYIFLIDKSEKIVVEENPIEESIQENSQRYEEEPTTQTTTPTDSAAIAPALTDSLYLTFISKETSWIYVIMDDNKTQEFTLSPNSKFTVVTNKDFKVTVGNSGGVSLQLNGQPIEFSGRSGAVRNFKLDRTGLVYLTAPPKLEKQ